MIKELNIEDGLVAKLSDLKYTVRTDIGDRIALEKNFREKFEAHNRIRLTDDEFKRLRNEIIDENVFASAKRLRETNTFVRDDGKSLDYTLLNIKDWCKNDFEVVNQLQITNDKSYHRYDVVILINGIPLVHIELKTLHINPRKAMEQIVKYKNDSGSSFSNSLFCFVQLFVVSNLEDTRYFANNNNEHFKFNAEEQFLPVYQFATEDNKKVTHLYDFAEKFLSKCKLSEMISRYMVLVATEKKLLVMRPYQIYAVKAITDCIHQNRGNGYIWHTTGSGKTLTSFKASTLLKDNPEIEKCLFVVDRKDLDRQTREEFNKFQEGCVEQNTNTEALVNRMLSEDYANKVIVTTIQKLGLALDPNTKANYKERLEKLRKKRIVFIFDECHRSQFGENHKAIKDFFPNSQLFGFTGTPIFEDNSNYKQIDGNNASYLTTIDIFQKQLHAYTITHAIEDKNVLRFHIDYFKPEKDFPPSSREHKIAVVNSILAKHNAATKDRLFNAVFATASINDAIEYYALFKEQQAKKLTADENYRTLNIACVFSPPAEGNKDTKQLQEDLQQEKEDNKTEPEEKKKALQQILDDYNKKYGTNCHIAEFDLYYQDVQQRIKAQKYPNTDFPHSKKIDIVIVVDMLLTGFDSKYLNTLYVDKNLKYHGLIQAFSRTNRILNDTKPFGNILDFRQQQAETDAAVALFSGESGDRAKEIWLVESAPKVIEQYEKAVVSVKKYFDAFELEFEPNQVFNLKGDATKAEFINRFLEVQKLKNNLDQFTDLDETQKQKIEELLPEDKLRSFKSAYLEVAKKFKAKQEKSKSKLPENIAQLDFEFVLFASALIDYDYIMNLIAKFTQDSPKKQKMTREQLIQILTSTANLMGECDDMIAYIKTLKVGIAMTEQEIKDGFIHFKAEKAQKVLQEMAEKNGLQFESLQNFINEIFERMIFDAEKLTELFQPLDLGWLERADREAELMKDLIPLLKKQAGRRKISGIEEYEKNS